MSFFLGVVMPTRRQFLTRAVPVVALLATPLAIPLVVAAAKKEEKPAKPQCCGYSGTHTVVTGVDLETMALIMQELRFENGLIVSIS